MEVQHVEIDEIRPYPGNPRHNESAVDKVAASIQEFGWKQPIVVDADKVVIAGHTRLLAAKKLGLTQCPIVIADDLEPAQVRAYRIADNRTGEDATWDEELLGIELRELEGEIDLSTLGFEADELKEFSSINNTKILNTSQADDIPDLPAEPITQLGDIWQLGDHRLICGDSTDPACVEKLLDGAKPHLMVTDPPYGVEYDANWRKETYRADGQPYRAGAIGKVENDNRIDWQQAWRLFPGDVAYIWHAGWHARAVAESLEICDFVIRCQIIWAKTQFSISRGHYHWQHEPCWYAVKRSAIGHWSGNRSQSTLWTISHNKSDSGHSTQKPVECMRRPIENNSEFGDIVYEPFSGSGTTIIAAENIGRVCYAIELSPEYVDLAVKRWENFTGDKAKRL